MKRSICCLIFILAWLVPVSAGAGELVVVVNVASGIGKLSRDQVLNIFLGRFRQSPGGFPIEPIDQPEGGPAKAQFYRQLVDKDVAEISAYWARLVFSGRTRPPLQTQNSSEVLRLLMARRDSISYMDRAEVDPRLVIVFSFGHDPQ